jgi:hypothetical protein
VNPEGAANLIVELKAAGASVVEDIDSTLETVALHNPTGARHSWQWPEYLAVFTDMKRAGVNQVDGEPPPEPKRSFWPF